MPNIIQNLSDIIICGIGDSHTNGQVDSMVATAGQSVAQPLLDISTRDFVISGANTLYSYFNLDSNIADKTGTADPNIGITDTMMSYLSMVPGCVRKSLPLLNDITICNFGAGGSSFFSWTGEQSHAYIAALGAPADGDTVEIDGQAYRFKDVPSQNYDVLIGSANDTNLYLGRAINGEGGAGFFPGTPAHPTVYSPNPAADVYHRIMAKRAGAAGNAIVISASDITKMAPATVVLAVGSPVNMGLGSDTSALWANCKTTLGAVSPDFFIVTLGTNDAERAGYRGAYSDDELAVMYTNILADYPNTHIIFVTPPVSLASAPAPTAVETIAQAIRDFVGANESCSYADMFAVGAGGTGAFRIVNSGGTHCSPYGYSIMAQLVAKKIVSVVQQP